MTTRDDVLDASPAVATLVQALESDLLRRYGPLIGHDDLRQALGYPTMDAFRQALSRRQLPVPVFAMPHRRGKYALAKDVAHWLARLRHASIPVAPHGSCRPSGPPEDDMT
ncbi:MAG: hypothetical protein B7X31_13230 [Thiomonas sp. 13-66-29]|jgi:hypothetical protein|nr:MAG: hypothetical protein B7X31_13230 [Thiomonas sp. 13-66-29]